MLFVWLQVELWDEDAESDDYIGRAKFKAEVPFLFLPGF